MRSFIAMWATALTVVPVGLVLGLVVFGRYGDRQRPPPTPRRLLATAAAAVLLGPVAISQLGLLLWLVAVAVVAAGLAAIAGLRAPRQPLQH